jgi:hypothetical protein
MQQRTTPNKLNKPKMRSFGATSRKDFRKTDRTSPFSEKRPPGTKSDLEIVLYLVLNVGSMRCRIEESWRGRLHRQIVDWLAQQKSYVYYLAAMKEELHVLLKLPVEASADELIRGLRRQISVLINEGLEQKGRFFFAPRFKICSIHGQDILHWKNLIRSRDDCWPDDFNAAIDQ